MFCSLKETNDPLARAAAPSSAAAAANAYEHPHRN